jgi:hypothetical protein
LVIISLVVITLIIVPVVAIILAIVSLGSIVSEGVRGCSTFVVLLM